MAAAAAATTTPVVDVEAVTTNTPTTTIPELKAPESQPLKDATALRDRMGADLVIRALAYDYKVRSPTMVAFYKTFQCLVFPSESEEDELVSPTVGRTTGQVPYNQRLHLLGLTLIPDVVLGRGLMAYYDREGSRLQRVGEPL